MATQFFLRRTATGQSRQDQYLFLIADNLSLGTNESLIAPALPFNDSKTVAGRGSNNFSLPLGIHKFAIKASGTFLNVSQASFPGPLPPNVYDPSNTGGGLVGTPVESIYLPGGTPGGDPLGAFGSPHPARPPNPALGMTIDDFAQRPTAKVMRSMFVNFFADQVNYTDHCVGWPKWLDDGPAEQAVRFLDPFPDGLYVPGVYNNVTHGIDPTIGSVSYRLWRGNLMDMQCPVETPDNVKQYPWSMSFGVGDPL